MGRMGDWMDGCLDGNFSWMNGCVLMHEWMDV